MTRDEATALVGALLDAHKSACNAVIHTRAERYRRQREILRDRIIDALTTEGKDDDEADS